MPRMDGLQAARTIRQEVPESEVIIVSQNDPEIIARQTAEVGARGYISKSNMARELIPLIEKIASQKGSQGRSLSPVNSNDVGLPPALLSAAAVTTESLEERPRILLVDDNVDMREYVRRLLGARYDVHAVADGEAALKAIHQRLPDLVAQPRRADDAFRPIGLRCADGGVEALASGEASGSGALAPAEALDPRAFLAKLEPLIRLESVEDV